MRSYYLKFFIVFSIFLGADMAWTQTAERFPKPDFQTDYVRPDLLTPQPTSQVQEGIDVFVLIGTLSVATYFVLKQRSRKKVFALMIFSLFYFGFFRKGCVCSVGALQNVSYALFHSSYSIPLTVIAFFTAPLIFTLFWGRTFCAAVCPLGAIQDVVILKPVKVPVWLSHILSLVPYIYFGLAVLFAVTGAGFIICQYDPFVGIFRFGASFNMVLFGISILILGTVVARPYCRFLCPYGVLLNWMSRLSKKHMTITPDTCNNCRLCEESCPFGAINKSNADNNLRTRKSEVKRLAILLGILPIVVVLSGWTGSRLSEPLSRYHFTVSLAREIQLENVGLRVETTEETDAFRASGRSTEDLMTEAETLQKQFHTGGWVFGMFLGLILCLKLIQLTIPRKRTVFTADRGTCFSCARCISYCPFEQVRIGKISPEEIPQ
jgi:NosR/NirI family nitrous oxide reductase transcriptional regulator